MGPPAQPNSDNNIRTDAPPTNGIPHWAPGKFEALSSLPFATPYDKCKRHPSIENESATPCAKIKPVPSIEHHNSPSGASVKPRPPTDDSVTNAHTSFESHEILPTTPPKTTAIGAFPLSNKNSHPVDSLEPTSLPESWDTVNYGPVQKDSFLCRSVN